MEPRFPQKPQACRLGKTNLCGPTFPSGKEGQRATLVVYLEVQDTVGNWLYVGL